LVKIGVFLQRLPVVRQELFDFFDGHIRQTEQDMMEIFEDRHVKNATIIASPLLVASWNDLIGEPTIADAILDPIVHAPYLIELKGNSQKICNFIKYSGN
jgi:hypothetical protein